MSTVHIATKLQGVTSAITGRFATGGALVSKNGDDGGVFVSATDGRCAAVLRCPGSADGLPEKGSIIPRDLLPNVLKGGDLVFNGENWHHVQKAKTAEPIDATFPPLYDVVPDLESGYDVAVSLNVELLAAVAKAVGHDGPGGGIGSVVTLYIRVEDGTTKRAIGVYGSADRLGVIMPIRTESTDRGRFMSLAADYQKAVRP